MHWAEKSEKPPSLLTKIGEERGKGELTVGAYAFMHYNLLKMNRELFEKLRVAKI